MDRSTSAEQLDAADPLAALRDRFAASEGLVAYLDGNSLGRPLTASIDRIATMLQQEWGDRLIRSWDEGWLDLPLAIGDELGRVCLGAAPGQVAVGDSTTVLLYKAIRAAIDARPGRDEVVIDRDSFPTDRYVLEGIAADRGLTVRWIETDASAGVTPDLLAEQLSDRTALVLLNHVAYRSGFLADAPTLTRLAHDAGALAIWDLSHSAGVVPVQLDAWHADLAVGCGYKYLGGGPGAPAFVYVAALRQAELRQPIHGWLGSEAPFEMGQGYVPARGIRGFLSGTPPIVGMQAMRDMIALIDEAGAANRTPDGTEPVGAGGALGTGIAAVRAKSVALTSFGVEVADELLPSAVLSTPRDPDRRGGHITLDHPSFEAIMPRLWKRGVIPDFRRPTGIRLGMSPLSTSFAEVEAGLNAIAEELARV
ncbi:MAG: aminotransferase class V-fold PLP-dependent enzyme [Actinomycetota bacterium]|nr:aminotransferase class V-fold PLP-dependent enzyme [Actinomycetota bacterium]